MVGSNRKPACRLVRPVHAVAVELPRLHARHERVPVVVGPVGDGIEGDDAGRLRVVLAVEEQQFHAGRGAREQAEVDAAIQHGRPEGSGLTGNHGVHGGSCNQVIADILPESESQHRASSAEMRPNRSRSCAMGRLRGHFAGQIGWKSGPMGLGKSAQKSDFFSALRSAVGLVAEPRRKEAPETTFGLEEVHRVVLEAGRDPATFLDAAVELARVHNVIADQEIGTSAGAPRIVAADCNESFEASEMKEFGLRVRRLAARAHLKQPAIAAWVRPVRRRWNTAAMLSDKVSHRIVHQDEPGCFRQRGALGGGDLSSILSCFSDAADDERLGGVPADLFCS